MIPLVSNALLRSNVFGLAIDMRGYRIGARTHVRERKFLGSDYLVLSVLVFVCVGFIFFTIEQML